MIDQGGWRQETWERCGGPRLLLLYRGAETGTDISGSESTDTVVKAVNRGAKKSAADVAKAAWQTGHESES